ncbi:MAG: PD40 domain-containing protein [Anaerolineae bacterium]|nr:PD40 domain-containing protein [Anaerolineae bacterium]
MALLLVACSAAQDAVSEGAAAEAAEALPAPTETPTVPPLPTVAPTEPPASEQVEPVEVEVEPAGPRTVEIETLEGHLLVATSADGLTVDTIWLADASGKQVRKLVDNVSIIMPWDAELDQLVSPNQTIMAVITTANVERYEDLWLELLDLETGMLIPITPLTSFDTEPGSGDYEYIWDDPNFQVVRAFTELNSVAWSPDGQLLAFMGAIDGPTSDLYVYSMAEKSISRLTDGPSQGIHPVFSPDGKYIVHAGVGSLGTGAGYSMEGVWAAAADGSEVLSLYDPSRSGDEVFVGWESPGTLIVYSWSAAYGPHNLRRVTILNQLVEPIYEGAFGDIAYDPETHTAVFTLDQYMAEVDGSQPGVFFIASDGTVSQIDKSDSYRPVYSPEAGAFFVWTSAYNALQVNTDGSFVQLPNPTDRTPVVSPDGYYRAWSTNYSDGGLWIGPGVDPMPVFDGPVIYPTWHPTSDLIAFISADTLYFAAAEDFDVIMVAKGIDPTNWQPAWID